jgi:hypothetical protein
MKYYECDAHIKATPATIWSVLLDGASYPKWDSGVVRVEGDIAEGKRIKVRSAVSPSRAFPVKVHLSADGSSMTWTGGMPLGLFRGVRTFTLHASDGDSTSFRMREEYSGPLLGLIWKSMPDLGPSFEQFARGLKQRCEDPPSNQ